MLFSLSAGKCSLRNYRRCQPASSLRPGGKTKAGDAAFVEGEVGDKVCETVEAPSSFKSDLRKVFVWTCER